MTKVIYYTASSLDGFVADHANSLDWLVSHDNDPHGPLGFEAFQLRVGAMIMGRTTFDWLENQLRTANTPWSHPQPCWVLTSSALPNDLDGADIRTASGDPTRVVDEMVAAANGLDVWCVGGGRTAGWLHSAGLIDEVWVSIAPEILGRGVPLLDGGAHLELIDVARNNSFVAARYSVIR